MHQSPTAQAQDEDLSVPAALSQLTPKIRGLSRLQPSRFWAAVIADWGIIASCFVAAMVWPHVLLWIAAAVIIATRQHALLILMHEAAHHRMLRSRSLADRLSNWLLAYPLFIETEGYRRNHLAHHANLNTDRDPDWVRKRGRPEWEFPTNKRSLLLLLLRDLFGGGALVILGIAFTTTRLRCIEEQERGVPGWRRLRLERWLYYLLVGVVLTVFDLWLPVALLWLVPAFTLLPVLLRIRSIAEHFGVEGDHDFTMSRNTLAPRWQLFLMAPHNINYHLDHHLYPSVPFYSLPRLHQVLVGIPEYGARGHQSNSYLALTGSSVLAEITRAGSMAE